MKLPVFVKVGGSWFTKCSRTREHIVSVIVRADTMILSFSSLRY